MDEMELKRKARLAAITKLSWIISREGDGNGERLKPYYLEELTREKELEFRLQEYTEALMEKKMPRGQAKLSGA